MTSNLLNYLCELVTKASLQLVDSDTHADGGDLPRPKWPT